MIEYPLVMITMLQPQLSRCQPGAIGTNKSSSTMNSPNSIPSGEISSPVVGGITDSIDGATK